MKNLKWIEISKGLRYAQPPGGQTYAEMISKLPKLCKRRDLKY